MGKFGDALKRAAKASARAGAKQAIHDAADAAQEVVDAIVDDGSGAEDEGGEDEAPGMARAMGEMAIDALNGVAALITVIEDVGEAVVKAEDRFTKKNRAIDPQKVFESVVKTLEPKGDGNDELRAFFRGMIYSAVALAGGATASDDDE